MTHQEGRIVSVSTPYPPEPFRVRSGTVDTHHAATFFHILKYLEEHNFINVAKVGTANAYIINPEVAFQNAHNKKKYVGFNGTILLSKKENNTLFDKYNYNNIKVLNEKE